MWAETTITANLIERARVAYPTAALLLSNKCRSFAWRLALARSYVSFSRETSFANVTSSLSNSSNKALACETGEGAGAGSNLGCSGSSFGLAPVCLQVYHAEQALVQWFKVCYLPYTIELEPNINQS